VSFKTSSSDGGEDLAARTWALHIAWLVRDNFFVTAMPNHGFLGTEEEEDMAWGRLRCGEVGIEDVDAF
jgi:hypothetical protein